MGCGPVPRYDCAGERLSPLRVGRMPEAKKTTLKEMLSADVRAALEQRPYLDAHGLELHPSSVAAQYAEHVVGSFIGDVDAVRPRIVAVDVDQSISRAGVQQTSARCLEMRVQLPVSCKCLPIAVISFVGYAQCRSVPWGTAVDDHFRAGR